MAVTVGDVKLDLSVCTSGSTALHSASGFRFTRVPVFGNLQHAIRHRFHDAGHDPTTTAVAVIRIKSEFNRLEQRFVDRVGHGGKYLENGGTRFCFLPG